jgi:inosine-uridine nucleoside N-ribohydrolase
MSQKKVAPVVIDCDPGSDDAWAIISMLKCEERFNLKLKAITVANGNTSTENSSRNALLILKTLNRLDVPVFIGAESSLLVKPGYYPKFHGKDGFSDVYDDKPSRNLVQSKHAVEALKEIIESVRTF